MYAWPAIEFAEGSVNVRLFRSRDLARAASLTGVQRLVELAIQKDLAWLERDLRALSRYDALYSPLGDSAELRETALEHLKRHLLPAEPWPALTRANFETAVAEARQRLPGLAPQFMDRLGLILQLRQQVAATHRRRSGSRAPALPIPFVVQPTRTHLPLFAAPIRSPMNWPVWCRPVFWSASPMTG